MNQVVLGIASNIDPESNVARTRAIIAAKHRLLAESRFVETAPVGPAKQPFFLNGVMLIETALGMTELKSDLREIELQLGRVRTANKYLPREIDLDLLVWNGEIIDSDVRRRDFLRALILEICPELTEQIKTMPLK